MIGDDTHEDYAFVVQWARGQRAETATVEEINGGSDNCITAMQRNPAGS